MKHEGAAKIRLNQINHGGTENTEKIQNDVLCFFGTLTKPGLAPGG
jgi:hypothetical protein